MLLAIGSLTVIGIAIGTLFGVAYYAPSPSEPTSLTQWILAVLPGCQCGQCGFIGCAQAAAALVAGRAPVTLCRPGGETVARTLAGKLGGEAVVTRAYRIEQPMVDDNCSHAEGEIDCLESEIMSFELLELDSARISDGCGECGGRSGLRGKRAGMPHDRRRTRLHSWSRAQYLSPRVRWI